MSTTPQLSTILHSHRIDTTLLHCETGADQEAVYYLSVPGKEAVARWETLRTLVPETGYWPVILGGIDDYRQWHAMELERFPSLPSPTALLEASRKVDAEMWLAEAAKNLDLEREIATELIMAEVPDDEVLEDDDLEARVDELLASRTVTLDDLLRIWRSDVQPRRTFDSPYRSIWNFGNTKPLPTVHVRFVPTMESWLVPAYLRWGGVNHCPTPQEQVSLLRRWKQQYGAEVISIRRDGIELYVHNPPDNRKDALKLAYEQYVYCPDLIHQITDFPTLAALLLGGIAWSFGWD